LSKLLSFDKLDEVITIYDRYQTTQLFRYKIIKKIEYLTTGLYISRCRQINR